MHRLNGMNPSPATSYADSKYTVADILSSMANGGEPPTPTSTFAAAFLSSSVPTGTTPTLTPTTLASIEQTFIELQSVAAPPPPGFLPTPMRAQLSAGFVPPVVDPVSASSPPEAADPDWMPRAAKRSRGGVVVSSTTHSSPSSSPEPPHRRTGGRRRGHDTGTPEEIARRGMRRERNKLAAAKCRQRRVDLTNCLMTESDDLESCNSTLEDEIQTLQAQKEQYEFLLQAHRPLCSKKLPQGGATALPLHIKQEADEEVLDCFHPHATSRPNSLALAKRTLPAVTEATGVSINTPSGGVFSFSLDQLVDHTGLTPLTSGLPSASCASQQRTGSDSSPDLLLSPTKLMAL